jgi:hypothetical protein
MAKRIMIHAGDFPVGVAVLHSGQILLPREETDGFQTKTVAIADLDELEVASEESVKRLSGTLGWGVAGVLILGPVGLLAGLLEGGKRMEVTFVAKFKDGRRMLGAADSQIYKTMLASTFNKRK